MEGVFAQMLHWDVVLLLFDACLSLPVWLTRD